MRRGLAVACLIAAVRLARADDEADAERALRAAEARGSIDELEAIGAGPRTRWSDNAWREAARGAERAGDFARARRDLERARDLAEDDVARRRDDAELARLAGITGEGRWDAVVAEHERLASAAAAPGDPRPALAALEELVRANPAYPRRGDARLAIARGWEREGDAERALVALDAAVSGAPTPADERRARVARIRLRIGARDLDDARAELDAMAGLDPPARAELEDELDRARTRHRLRLASWIALALAAVAAAAVARAGAGSSRAALRRIARPPLEVAFLAPIAIVLAVIAQTGNPLVARSVRVIAIAGVVVAWISGALLDGAPRPLGRRALAHAAVATLAVAAASYLALDHGRMLDLVVETWRGGPQMR